MEAGALPALGGPLGARGLLEAVCAAFDTGGALAEDWGRLTTESGVRPGDLEEPGPVFWDVLICFLATDTIFFSFGSCAFAGVPEATESGWCKFKADLSLCAGPVPACGAPSAG